MRFSRNAIAVFIVGLGGFLVLSSTTDIAMPSRTPAPVTTTSTTVLHRVIRVVDGDTLVVDMQGVPEKVRLIGINTPETVDPRKPVECFGKEASDAAKRLLAGQVVRIETDSSQGERDKYGRLLAYVFLPNDVNINRYMIAEGYAYEYTYHVPYQYQKEFKQAQRDAEAHHKGLWAAGVCE